jgi:hypothetical protein
MPEIPSQRAIISYRDGVETLVVESSYATDSPAVGWILPIPAEPQSIEVADRDVLESVAMCMRPRMVHDLEQGLWAVRMALLIVGVCSAAMIASPKGGRLEIIVVAVLAFFFLLSIMLPSLSAGGGSADIAGIHELSLQRVGGSEVATLKAKDATALQGWLKANKLAELPAAGVPLIEDYAKQGWVFLVAKVAGNGAGESAAHPLAVKFATQKPVFPMRLTALAGTTTQVDLYIAGDGAASAEGFTLKSADRYERIKGEEDLAEHYEATRTRLAIGSPDAARYLWDGCVVTHLSASLTPAEQMKSDVSITLSPFTKPHRETVYSSSGRRQAVQVVLLLGGVCMVLLLGVACRYRQWPNKLAIRTLAVLVMLTLAGAVYVWSMYPVVELAATSDDVDNVIVWSRGRLIARQQQLRARVSGAVHPDDVRAVLNSSTMPANDRRWLANPLTGKPIREERTPGNYTVREIDGTIFLCLYDVDGRERRYDLKEMQ